MKIIESNVPENVKKVLEQTVLNYDQTADLCQILGCPFNELLSGSGSSTIAQNTESILHRMQSQERLTIKTTLQLEKLLGLNVGDLLARSMSTEAASCPTVCQSLGQRIKLLREERGLTVGELAKAVGVSQKRPFQQQDERF